MSKNIKIVIGLVLVIILGVFGYSALHRKDAVAGSTQGAVDITTTNFTSISSANGIANGGIFTSATRVSALNQATTTVCAIQSPAATTTLQSAGISFTVGSTTAAIVSLAKATSAFATTTSLGQASLAANAQGTFTASTTKLLDVPLDGLSVFAPSTWFVVGMAGLGSQTYTPTGVCQAVFQSTI
jgi:hypothetical protein